MLDFKHRETFQRNHSFKGRDRERLLPTADEQEVFIEKIEKPESPIAGEEPPRPKSPRMKRDGKLRPLMHEHWIVHDVGFRKKTADDFKSNLGSQAVTPGNTEDFMSDVDDVPATTPGGSPVKVKSRQRGSKEEDANSPLKKGNDRKQSNLMVATGNPLKNMDNRTKNEFIEEIRERLHPSMIDVSKD